MALSKRGVIFLILGFSCLITPYILNRFITVPLLLFPISILFLLLSIRQILKSSPRIIVNILRWTYFILTFLSVLLTMFSFFEVLICMDVCIPNYVESLLTILLFWIFDLYFVKQALSDFKI